MKKKLLAYLLVFAMLISTVSPMAVSAEETDAGTEPVVEAQAEDEMVTAELVEEETSEDAVEEVVESEELIDEENSEDDEIVDDGEDTEGEEGSVLPIESFECNDITVIEKTAGWFNTDYNEEGEEVEWFYYYIEPDYEITYPENVDIQEESGGFWLDDEWYQIDCHIGDGQSYDAQLTAGNTYSVTAYIEGVEGFETSFNLTIEESPVDYIELEPIEVKERTDGTLLDPAYDEVEGDGPWFRYEFYVNGTIYLKNGDEITIENDQFTYEGKEEYVNAYWDSEQSYENQWDLGTHTVTIKSILGKEASVDVTVVENNTSFTVESISIPDVEYFVGTNGSIEKRYDENGDCIDSYYNYFLPYSSGTVCLDNGDELSIEDGGIWYEGEWHGLSYFDGQHEEPWGIGEHEVTVQLLDYETTFTITINEVSVEKFTVEDAVVFEKGNGDYWEIETEDGVDTYFHYSYPCKGELVLEGDTIEFDERWFECFGESVEIAFDDDQSYWNQWDIGTHTVTASVFGVETEFTVEVVESPIEDVKFEPVEILAGTRCWYEEEYNSETDSWESYYYYYSYYPKITVFFNDGTSYESDGDYILYNGERYELVYYTGQSVETPWGVGTHEVTVNILGKDYTYDVEIKETAIADIQVEDRIIYENTNGYYDYTYDDDGNEDGEYYYYSDIAPNWRIEFEDGTVQEGNYNWIDYDGWEYDFDYETDQNEDNPWSIGTHKVTATIMGKTVEYNIIIKECPIVDIKVEPVSFPIYSNGYMERDAEEPWFYHSYYYPECEITFEDGTVVGSSIGDDIEYNGDWYEVWKSSDQSYDNQWKVGTNTAYVNIMGKEFPFEVELTESPIEKVVLDDIRIIEYTNGEWTDSWDDEDWEDEEEWWDEWSLFSWEDEEEGSEDTSYYYYYVDELDPSYTVYYKDGSSEESSGDWYYDKDGNEYELSVYTDQSAENPWEVSKKNIYTAYLGGIECEEATVEIIESPVESVEFEPVQYIEHTHGYWSYSDEYGSDYYKYSIYDDELECTVTLNDGTVLESEDGGVEYEGVWYGFDMLTSQWEQPLELGPNEVLYNVMGYEAKLEVEIIKSPYVSLEVLKVKPIREGENAYLSDGEWYYEELPEFSYRITDEDGNSFIGYSKNDDIDFEYPDLYEEDDEWFSENWKPGNVYKIKVTYANLEAEIPVIVTKSDDFEYEVIDGAAYITNASVTTETVNIPEEIDGYTVKGIKDLGWTTTDTIKHLIVPDSVESITAGYLGYQLRTVELGSGVKDLDANPFASSENLECITVSKDNPYYCDIDGVVYDKDVTTLIAYPRGLGREFTVPATVTNFDVLNLGLYENVKVTISEDNDAFIVKDGVTYTADMKKIVACDPSKVGELVIPDSVKEIAPGAFDNCRKLTKVKVGSGVTSIEYMAFSNCRSLTEVTLPSTITAINDKAFLDCGNIKNIELPQNVKKIGVSAFNGAGLASVELPDSLEEIDAFAFSYNDIEEVIIPDSVTFLGSNAFRENSGLTTVTVGAGINCIPDSAFAHCNRLSDVTLKNKNVTVEAGAFANAAIKEFDFENVKGAIGTHAFGGTDITSLKLTDGVTAIEYSAFANCTKLASIELPDSIVSVAGNAFNESPAYRTQADGVVYIDNVLYDYKGKMPKDTEIKVKAGTTVIAEGAFDKQKNLTSIELPEGLKAISNSAFIGCAGLTEITIPASVTYIGEEVFAGCSGLTAVHVDKNNTEYKSVDGVLFTKDGKELIYCPNIGEDTYTVLADVAVIKAGAFGNNGVDKVVVPGENTMLELRAIGYDGYNKVYKEIECIKGSDVHFYAEENLFDVKVIEGCSHNYKVVEEVKATCTEDGKRVEKCSKCGHELTEILTAKGHTEVVKEAKDATCTEAGWTKGITCSVCKAVILKSTTIKALGHKEEVTKVAQKASCGVAGWTEEISCSVCGTVIKESKPIAALSHEYGSWEVTEPASFDKDGVRTKTCENCGDVKEETIPMVSNVELSYYTTTYNGNVKKPSVTIETSGEKPLSTSYYSVKYESGRKYAGRYTVTITLKGNYQGEEQLTFDIQPKAPSSATAKLAEGNAIKLTWKESYKAAAYNVYYRVYGSDEEFIFFEETTERSSLISGLKAGTKYEFKVVPCYDADGTIIESSKYVTTSLTTLAEVEITGVEKYSSTQTKVLWKNVANETGYQIEYTDADGNVSTKRISTTTGKSTTVSVSKYEEYKYRVRAYKTVDDERIYGPWSAYETFTLWHVYAAKDVEVKLDGEYNKAEVSWEEVKGANGYNVYTKVGSESYGKPEFTTECIYSVEELTDGAKYTFKVEPVYVEDGEEVMKGSTDTAVLYVLKSVPGIKVSKSSSKKVKVKWTNISGETGYEIARATDDDVDTIEYSTTYKTTSGTSKTISAKKGTTYYYFVRAYKTVDGEKIYGPWSDGKSYKLK